MTLSKDYRTRAAQVRRSARAHLKEIRRARMARKEDDSASDVEDIPAEVEDVTVTAPADELFQEDAEASFEEVTPQPASEPKPEAPENTEAAEHAALADMFDEPPDMSDPQMEAPAPPSAPSSVQDVENPAPDDLVLDEIEQETSVAGEDMPPAPDPEPLEVPEPAPTETEADFESSDLNALPGAGPGLVWMLHQCGVRSLADLAESDPDVLTPKLGVVGQILDVGKWIDFASNERPAAQ